MSSEFEPVGCDAVEPTPGVAGPVVPRAVPLYRRISRRRIVAALGVAVVLGLATIFGAAYAVRRAAQGRTYASVAAIPHRQVGLVLGCNPRIADGRRNDYYSERILAAATLYRAGKVDYLLVSGDNRQHGYDEPSLMKASLEAAGVPAGRIVCDYAGFRTLDSVARAGAVFGLKDVTVVSQHAHNERAIYLASHFGVDAIAFDAGRVDPVAGPRAYAREALARVKMLLDVHVLGSRPHFYGPAITIGAATPAVSPAAI